MYKTSGSTALSRRPGSFLKRTLPGQARIHPLEQVNSLRVEKMIHKQMARKRAAIIIRFLASLVLLIAVFGGILYRYSVIMEMNYMNVRMEREIRRMEDETRLIREELAARTDLRTIRVLATEQLYMQDPSMKQKVRVIVPRSDQMILEDQSLSSDAFHQDMNAVYANLEGFFKKLR